MTNTLQADGKIYPHSFVCDFYYLMLKNDIIMIYEGDFSQEITKSVLAMTERNFDAENIDSGIKRKVYNVMVESLQNICKHQMDQADPNAKAASIFMIGHTETDYLVISGNALPDDKVQVVKEKLDHINSLDKEGLKQLYKETRLSGTISSVGGAGLGFIDMARKSGNSLEYYFDPVFPGISYFTLMSVISKKEE